MGVSGTIAFLSGATSLFLIVLYSIEARREARFAEPLRAVLDSLILRIDTAFRTRFPEINSVFFQELFYYVLHLLLSRFLHTVRRLEQFVLRVVRFNRMQAMKLRERDTVRSADPHLVEIAEHKRAVELSPRQKARHKEASIEG